VTLNTTLTTFSPVNKTVTYTTYLTGTTTVSITNTTTITYHGTVTTTITNTTTITISVTKTAYSSTTTVYASFTSTVYSNTTVTRLFYTTVFSTVNSTTTLATTITSTTVITTSLPSNTTSIYLTNTTTTVTSLSITWNLTVYLTGYRYASMTAVTTVPLMESVTTSVSYLYTTNTTVTSTIVAHMTIIITKEKTMVTYVAPSSPGVYASTGFYVALPSQKIALPGWFMYAVPVNNSVAVLVAQPQRSSAGTATLIINGTTYAVTNTTEVAMPANATFEALADGVTLGPMAMAPATMTPVVTSLPAGALRGVGAILLTAIMAVPLLAAGRKRMIYVIPAVFIVTIFLADAIGIGLGYVLLATVIAAVASVLVVLAGRGEKG
jgi:hypothetical protein